MSLTQCPCGLTRAELDAHAELFLNGQICKAEYTKTDGTIGVCGKRYADHPSATTSSNQGNYYYLNI